MNNNSYKKGDNYNKKQRQNNNYGGGYGRHQNQQNNHQQANNQGFNQNYQPRQNSQTEPNQQQYVQKTAQISSGAVTGVGQRQGATVQTQMEGFNRNTVSPPMQALLAATQQESEELEKAARGGKDELLASLLKGLSQSQKSVSQRQLSAALHAAVEGCKSTSSVESHVSCINLLQGMGANINAEKEGKTILMIASSKGFLELVTEILEKDAWVNHGDRDWKTALHYAIDNKAENLDVVNLLIESNADINQETTSDGYTPLILAVKRGHQNIARVLILRGVKLDAFECNRNNTALHVACENGEKEIVEMLATVESFEKVFNALNGQKQKPLDVAEEKVIETHANQLSEKTEADQRYWHILEYLENLKEQFDDRAKKQGDNLINNEEQKRQKKLQKERENEQRKKQHEETIAQANLLKDQILSNEIQSQQKKKDKKRKNNDNAPDQRVEIVSQSYQQKKSPSSEPNERKQDSAQKHQEKQSPSQNQHRQVSTINQIPPAENNFSQRNRKNDHAELPSTGTAQTPAPAASVGFQNQMNGMLMGGQQQQNPLNGVQGLQQLNFPQNILNGIVGNNSQQQQNQNDIFMGSNGGLQQQNQNYLQNNMNAIDPNQMNQSLQNLNLNGMNGLNNFSGLNNLNGLGGMNQQMNQTLNGLNNLNLNNNNILNNQGNSQLPNQPLLDQMNLQTQLHNQQNIGNNPLSQQQNFLQQQALKIQGSNQQASNQQFQSPLYAPNQNQAAPAISMPVVPAGMQQNQTVSAAPNSNLPIMISLDFSDEKLQNLFIVEQKYNMKKNDCFMLEKQRAQLQSQLEKLNQNLKQKTQENEKLKQQLTEVQQKSKDQENETQSSINFQLVSYNQVLDKTIGELEESHNEQLNIVNYFKGKSDEKTKFSLEVINKSMGAVELLRKYKDQGKPSQDEVNQFENQISVWHEALQNDLIPNSANDPTQVIKNQFSLKMLKVGQTKAMVAGQQGLDINKLNVSDQVKHISQLAPENQVSNILEMEKRYETPLKQQNGTLNTMSPKPLDISAKNSTLSVGGANNQMFPQMPARIHNRHNFYEIQNILHNEILLFKQDANAILIEMQEVKQILIEKITSIVSGIYPNYEVSVYGSHASGLCLHWSDIDLIVGSKQQLDEKENITMHDARIKDALGRISDFLQNEKKNSWVTHVNFIEQASVPVVKVQCSLSALMDSAGIQYPKNQKYANIYEELFSIDITHSTEFHNGIKCVELVKEYLLDCWFIEPLILVLKQMLKVNGMNDPYKGGLSSYGLLLMLVAYIQFRKLNKVRIPNQINLGNMLLDFLHYYGEILQYNEYGIMCRKPGDLTESNNYYALIPEMAMFQANKVPFINDPLNPQNNVGKSSFQFHDIQKIFKVGYQSAFLGCFCNCHFFKNQTSPACCQPANPSSDDPPSPTQKSTMSLRSLPFMGNQNMTNPMAQGQIMYIDENNQTQHMNVESLFVQERIGSQEVCDSILTKIIYSQAQFKAAEENAM